MVVKTILYKRTIASGTSIDFRKDLRRCLLLDVAVYWRVTGERSRGGDAEVAGAPRAKDWPTVARRRRAVSVHVGQRHWPAQRHRQHHRALWVAHCGRQLFFFASTILAFCGSHVKKVAHTRSPSVGFRSWSRFLAVSLQVTWVINPAVGCHYFPPGLQLPLQLLRGLLGEQRHGGVNSLPKTVSRQRRGCDLNPGPSAFESSTQTTRLPSHPGSHVITYKV